MLPKLSLFNVTVLCLSTKHQRNHLRYGKGPYLRLCPCAASSLASSRAQGTTFPVCEKVQNILPLIAAYRSYPILTFGRRSRGERSSFVRFKMMYTSNSLCSCFWGRRPARFWRSFVNEFTCAKFSGAARLGFKLKDTYLHKIISDISSCFWSFGFPPGSGGGGSSCLMRSMYYWPGRCCFFAQGRWNFRNTFTIILHPCLGGGFDAGRQSTRKDMVIIFPAFGRLSLSLLSPRLCLWLVGEFLAPLGMKAIRTISCILCFTKTGWKTNVRERVL